MIEIFYSNIAETRAYYRGFLIQSNSILHNWIKKNISFTYGCGGHCKDILIIDCNDWDKLIEEINYLIESDYSIYRLQKTILRKR